MCCKSSRPKRQQCRARSSPQRAAVYRCLPPSWTEAVPVVLLLLTPAFCVRAGLDVDNVALATMQDGVAQLPAMGSQLHS